MQLPAFLRNFLPGKKPARRDDSAYSATFGNGAPGGFAGASVSRLTASLANWSAGINADNDAALTIMRARARQLAANNEYGKRFLSLVANNVVGRNNPQLQVRAYKDGPSGAATAATAVQRVLDKPANDAVEIGWARWGKTCDITGKHKSFPAFCRMIAKAAARDGEALVRKVRRRDLPFGFALQALEADRLDEGLNQTLSNGNTVRQGVEVDVTGRAVAYWIKPSHPGESYGVRSTVAERVLAQDVIHLFMPERAEQVRGITWFHAVILRNATIGRFEDAAVIAAEIGASKIAVLQSSGEQGIVGAGDILADSKMGGTPQINVQGGELIDLTGIPGAQLSSWNPEYPHANFESFLKTCLRGLGVGYDVAAHNLTGDMTDVNYSSARIAELAERECWMALQDWFINSFVMLVYEDWLALALLRGDITFEQSGKALPPEKFDKFFNASRFQGRRWAWVDPAKEMEANQLALSMRITSRTRIAAERGEDLDDILDELQQEEKMLADRKLTTPAPAPKFAEPAAENT